MNHIKIFDLVKTVEGSIYIPQVPKKFGTIGSGIYLWVYKGRVIKVGICGDGVTSTFNTRYGSYRTVSDDWESYLSGEKAKNGSVVPITTLMRLLKVGDKVEVLFQPSPEGRKIDGLPYKIDLPLMEKDLKIKHKDTIWLK
tara:strand:+ start:19 stop:441 length:423 start_codon:yes stop_codon:yes gene_type:complete